MGDLGDGKMEEVGGAKEGKVSRRGCWIGDIQCNINKFGERKTPPQLL